ncbi:unnamed protein product [Rotaria magnacalcarata]|uniref:Uncharacterized protein n=1 Tax=Rotaria magnacalcarata TaxID=392030 RepID=A0A816TXE6_9BILA|nr:unnamed protein product [Rotaria magnacalcarata]CAF2101765.1 unnamed protein product [Rotaria magnacalcarata]
MSQSSNLRSVWEEEGAGTSSSTSNRMRRFWPYSTQTDYSEGNLMTMKIRRLLFAIIAILAITLLVLLVVAVYYALTHSTSTSTSTTISSVTVVGTTRLTTSGTIACVFSNVSLLLSITSSPPTIFTAFSYLYNATSTTTTLRFTSATDNPTKDWFIDNVSVVDVASSGTNLLVNGDFESGASVGWQLHSCSGSCNGSIITSTMCIGGSGNCYNNPCQPISNLQLIDQSFNTNIGTTYNVTFYVLKSGSGVGPGISMYANIF